MAVWRGLPNLRDRTRFEPWLHQVVRNRCRDLLRRRRRVREIALDGHDVVVDDPGATSLDRTVLLAAFDRLSMDERRISSCTTSRRCPSRRSAPARHPGGHGKVSSVRGAAVVAARHGGTMSTSSSMDDLDLALRDALRARTAARPDDPRLLATILAATGSSTQERRGWSSPAVATGAVDRSGCVDRPGDGDSHPGGDPAAPRVTVAANGPIVVGREGRVTAFDPVDGREVTSSLLDRLALTSYDDAAWSPSGDALAVATSAGVRVTRASGSSAFFGECRIRHAVRRRGSRTGPWPSRRALAWSASIQHEGPRPACSRPRERRTCWTRLSVPMARDLPTTARASRTGDGDAAHRGPGVWRGRGDRPAGGIPPCSSA